MVEKKISVADLILIAGTRMAFGAGVGLLVANRLNHDQRKAAGLALSIVAGLTTIPLAMIVSERAGSGAERIRPAA